MPVGEPEWGLPRAQRPSAPQSRLETQPRGKGAEPSGRPVWTVPEGPQHRGRATQTRPRHSGRGERSARPRRLSRAAPCPRLCPLSCPDRARAGQQSCSLPVTERLLPATHRSALHAGPRQEVAPVRAVGGKRARTVPPGQGRVQAGVGGGCVRPAGRWAPGTLLIPVGLRGSLLLDSQHKPWFANCESQPEVTTPTEWVATSISETWYGAGRAHQNTSRSVFGEGGVCVHVGKRDSCCDRSQNSLQRTDSTKWASGRRSLVQGHVAAEWQGRRPSQRPLGAVSGALTRSPRARLPRPAWQAGLPWPRTGPVTGLCSSGPPRRPRLPWPAPPAPPALASPPPARQLRGDRSRASPGPQKRSRVFWAAVGSGVR